QTTNSRPVSLSAAKNLSLQTTNIRPVILSAAKNLSERQLPRSRETFFVLQSGAQNDTRSLDVPRRKSKAGSPTQTKLLDITAKLRTGPCVPALREAVKAWKAGGYKSVTETTRILLNHWFHT